MPQAVTRPAGAQAAAHFRLGCRLHAVARDARQFQAAGQLEFPRAAVQPRTVQQWNGVPPGGIERHAECAGAAVDNTALAMPADDVRSRVQDG